MIILANIKFSENSSHLALVEFRFGDLNVQHHRHALVKFKLVNFQSPNQIKTSPKFPATGYFKQGVPPDLTSDRQKTKKEQKF